MKKNRDQSGNNSWWEKSKQKLFGSFMLFFGMILLISLFFYNPKVSTILSAQNFENFPIYDILFANIRDLVIQGFGLISYGIAALNIIWGWHFITDKSHYIKHKYIIFIFFIVLGCVICNIASTKSFFINTIINKLNIDYYAGGMFGYVLSKLIFIDLLKQNSYCPIVYWIIVFAWLYIVKKAFFINFDIILEGTPKLFKKVRDNTPKLNFSTKEISSVRKKHCPRLEIEDRKIEEQEYSEELNINVEEIHKEEPQVNFQNLFTRTGGEYTFPNIDLLDNHSTKENYQTEEKIAALSIELLGVLQEFGVNGEIVNVKQGPVVTMFEFRPAPGIKTSRVISLSDDIARSMSAISARISTIPGQNAIGIEIPNKNRQTVYLKELIAADVFKNFSVGIPLILGKNISGSPILADLTKMPHLLVAGTTGSGKSVSVNDMILSILFKFSPKDCKLIMIDPKMLELSIYDEIPHLLTPVVTDSKKAVFALKWAVAEMENRYRQMSKLGVRNIDGFNKKLLESKEKGDFLVRKVQTGFDQETGRPIFETQQLEFKPMPYIVVIVDEMADLMLVAGKDVEAAIQRLAQMARAAGIHLIMATQRPSVDVITGTIKANFPTRISFQVTSKIDSRTILGEQGAEQLLGQGDMLYMSGAGRILRVHGPFVKDSEVERVVSYIKSQGEPDYVDVISDQFSDDLSFSDLSKSKDSAVDEMYKKALEIVLNDKKCSISYIQRKLQIGYNRAARIIEEMENQEVISKPNHAGKRDILI